MSFLRPQVIASGSRAPKRFQEHVLPQPRLSLASAAAFLRVNGWDGELPVDETEQEALTMGLRQRRQSSDQRPHASALWRSRLTDLIALTDLS